MFDSDAFDEIIEICDVLSDALIEYLIEDKEEIDKLNKGVSTLEKNAATIKTDEKKEQSTSEKDKFYYEFKDYNQEEDEEEIEYYDFFDEYGAIKPTEQILRELKDKYEDEDTWDLQMNIVDLFEFIEKIKK